MDFLKYFKNNEYIKGINNCWTFVQEVYKDEHDYNLPDVPVFDTPSEWKTYLKTNIDYRIAEKAHKGCLIHVWTTVDEHIGYAVDGLKYIHKTSRGVFVSPIPKKCIIYEVIQ